MTFPAFTTFTSLTCYLHLHVHGLSCAPRTRARNERFGERNVIFILQCFGFACLENENLESNGVKKVYRSEVNIHFNLSLIVILHYGADAGKDAWVTRDAAHAEVQHRVQDREAHGERQGHLLIIYFARKHLTYWFASVRWNQGLHRNSGVTRSCLKRSGARSRRLRRPPPRRTSTCTRICRMWDMHTLLFWHPFPLPSYRWFSLASFVYTAAAKKWFLPAALSQQVYNSLFVTLFFFFSGIIPKEPKTVLKHKSKAQDWCETWNIEKLTSKWLHLIAKLLNIVPSGTSVLKSENE